MSYVICVLASTPATHLGRSDCGLERGESVPGTFT